MELGLIVVNEGVVSKETVVLRRWGSSIQKFGFINGVDNVNWPPYRVTLELGVRHILTIDIVASLLFQNPLLENKFKISFPFKVGGAVASWLVCLTPDRAVRGSGSGQGHCVVFLGMALYSLHSGV